MTAGFQPPGYPPNRRPTNPVIFIGAALLGLVLLGGGLAWVLGMGPFARTSANTPGASSTPGPSAPRTLDATDGATDPPIEQPSSDVVPSPTVELTPGPPNDDTARLLTHVPEAVRGACVPGAFAEPVLARVDCTPATDISVYYALYENLADATDEYDRAFGRAEIDPDSGLCYTENEDGSLSATSDHWPSEHEYTQQQQPIGRYLCDIDGPPTITWTDDRLYILAVATSPTGDSDRLVSFWATEAGPIP
jgi:hypothetical protein